MKLPRLYPIIDAAVLAAREVKLDRLACALRLGGATLVQYRNKTAGPQTILRNSAVIAKEFAGSGVVLIMNDRADLAVLAGWSGVHVGQGDLSPEDAKMILAALENPRLQGETWGTGSGGESEAIVGVSTHSEAQVVEADAGMADYVAFGPVFATGTKVDASPVVGLESVRRARALTRKPLVAIGGITRQNALSVIDAGADAVAVISGLFVEGESVERVAREFLDLLR